MPTSACIDVKKQKRWVENESDLDVDAVGKHGIVKEHGTGEATLRRDKPSEKLVEAIDGVTYLDTRPSSTAAHSQT